MMPSGQIHLYETKSPDPLSREHASHQLDLHMTVLRELQKTYWTANMQYELFAKARVATNALPPASNAVPHQHVPHSGMAPGLTARELLPVDYGITGTPWGSYLDIPAGFDLAPHGQVHVNAALDFFSPVPAAQVAETHDRLEAERDPRYDSYE